MSSQPTGSQATFDAETAQEFERRALHAQARREYEEYKHRVAQREAALEGGARYGRSGNPKGRNTTETAVTECQNCGAHVDKEYVRVRGVNGRVDACQNCTPMSELLRGAVAGREHDRGERL